jgi:hypothetical protein
MRGGSRLVMALLFVWPHVARAQTVDQVADKCVAALGGRAAHAKLKSRSSIGSITLTTPGGDVSGSIEVLNAVPNKARTLIKADLSSFGAGQLVVDQRFDGTSGYVMDTLQGNRDITGNQLDNLRNGSFPHPLLNYKEMGATARLGAREKIGERDAYPLSLEPPSGSIVHLYIDAETYLPVKVMVTADVPQLGRELELTVEFLDYREVDGVKMPFQLKATSAVQNYTINFTKVEHNVRIDEALFSKPATP